MKQLESPFIPPSRIRLGVFLALMALALMATVALAHGPEVLLRTDPSDGATLEQSPSQVRAWFSAELDTGMSTLQVFDAEGRQVDNGDGGVDLNDPDHASMVVTLPPLSDGVYTAHWYAVLDDGDAVEGEFAFAVGNATVAAGQAPATAASSAAGGGWPLLWVAAGFVGIALVLIVGLTLRRRTAQR